MPRGFGSGILKKRSTVPLQHHEGKALQECIAVHVVMCFPGDLVLELLKATLFLCWHSAFSSGP